MSELLTVPLPFYPFHSAEPLNISRMNKQINKNM